MNVLVTGGAGYIGSATSYLLLKKNILPVVIDKLIYKKKNIVPKKVIFFKINIANINFIKKIIIKYKINSVIHFAAYKDVEESISKPEKYYKNNYIVTKKFIKCCKENGINYFIFSSSAAVYGKLRKNKKVSENTHLKPISPYGETKKKIEEYLKKISDNNFNFFSLRYFNVLGADKYFRYGPIGIKTNSLSNNLYKSIIRGKHFKIYGERHNTQDGSPVRDFIHIDDLAKIHYDALLFLKKYKKNQICNCGYGKGHSIKQVVKTLLKIKKFNFTFSFAKKRYGDISYMVADIKKINRLLNWKPKNSNLKKMLLSDLLWKKKYYK
jgi:UDP-glucose 4-epimerase